MVAATAAGAVQQQPPRFYVWMAIVFVAIAFSGFIPTFWAKVATGATVGRPVLYLHGVLMFTWTLFVLLQTSLVASRRIADHRTWGVAGVALSTAVSFTIVLVTIASMHEAQSAGLAELGLRASVVQLTNVFLFAGLITAGLLNVKRPEIHKRLMILAMVPIADPAIARMFRFAFSLSGAPPSPPSAVASPATVDRLLHLVAVPSFVADLLIVAAMVYDWRARGRPHSVYLIGGAIILANRLLYAPLSATPAWAAIAHWVESLTV
jgi:hypothetical protein